MEREEFVVVGKDVLKKLKVLVGKGMVRKIIVKNERGVTVIEVPLVVGLTGIALLPVWAAIGAAVALMASCTVVVEKEKRKK